MNKQYKQDFVRAGAMAREVLAYGKQLIQPGASYNQVIGQVREKIREVGGMPAFPPQIALDGVAAHFLPMPDADIMFQDQVVKLDVGVSHKGAIGDCATTVDLSGRYHTIVAAAEAALLEAERLIRVGLPLRDIGRTIERTIASFGLRPIRNLAGHGLGRHKIHTKPMIPNYDNRSSELIKPGMTFAIEPFATDGRGLIEEEGPAAIFSWIGRGRPHTPLAKSLVPILRSFQGLPFAIHDLIRPDWPLERLREVLDELQQLEVIYGHAPLVEEPQARVAQAENSVLVDDDGTVIVTTR